MAQSPETKMDITNLAKVFGPTIVAHAVPDPDPMTLLQDTKRQPKVGQRKGLTWVNITRLKNPDKLLEAAEATPAWCQCVKAAFWFVTSAAPGCLCR